MVQSFDLNLQVCKAYVVRELYGTHCSGRDFRQHLRECMKILRYTLCLADPDLWIRKVVNDNGCEYYEYMLLYLEDCLCVLGWPIEAFVRSQQVIPMKALSIFPPNIYLREKVYKVQLPKEFEAYDISMIQYVQESVKNVEKDLHDRGLALFNKASTPLLQN